MFRIVWVNCNVKRIAILVCFLITLSAQLCAQTFTDSNLPIVIVTTDGNKSIPNEPKILGSMKIIYRGAGQRNYVSDQTNEAVLNYNGRIGIEIRGSSSQSLEKKQYSLTTLLANNVTNNNVSLLGMPAENDWVLNGLAFDASLIRDYFSYSLARKMGNYAPRTVYCEVMINGNYRGLYMLQEKIKVDDNRVDVRKIETKDDELPDLSGGYIVKADKVSGDDVSAWAFSSYIGNNDVNFIHEFPKPKDITAQQSQYIKSQFEKLAITANSSNTSFSQGYPSVIDVPSFIDFMILNELAANVDGYQFSTYFHKDKNGKLRAGPLWDFNLTYGNDLYRWNLDRSKTDRWQFDNGDNIGARFWRDLFNNTDYRCYMAKRWGALTQSEGPLSLANLITSMDETIAMISEASSRNTTRWPPISEDQPGRRAYNYELFITEFKTFLEERITWMNNGLGSFAACNTVQVPPLVITKIMYNSNTTTEFPDSNDQEFIEIANNGNEFVDLTGVYFSGTGFVYQFPVGFVFPPQSILQLANHRETFMLKYGFSPFSEFTRSLNNEGQRLILSDGFGNVIDEVSYSNAAPWPDADGNGSYLELIDVNLDNNVGTNWVASTKTLATTITGTEDFDLHQSDIYPNPTENIINIKSRTPITALQLYDLQGRMLEVIPAATDFVSFSMSQYTTGLYLIHVNTNGKTFVRKVFKK